MTAKEFVKQHYPKARAERQVQGMIKGLQKVYWLIRAERGTMYMASGDTEAKAWAKAKERIVEQALPFSD